MASHFAFHISHFLSALHEHYMKQHDSRTNSDALIAHQPTQKVRYPSVRYSLACNRFAHVTSDNGLIISFIHAQCRPKRLGMDLLLGQHQAKAQAQEDKQQQDLKICQGGLPESLLQGLNPHSHPSRARGKKGLQEGLGRRGNLWEEMHLPSKQASPF